ncbi:MAG: hypothetical protein Kow0031_18630 [Anaerolineae bacterium]
MIDLGATPTAGQRVRCPNCEVVLEIINTDPLELDWVYDGPVTWSYLLNKYQTTPPANPILGHSA